MCSYSLSLLAISDTHKREKANLLATNSPTFGSHPSANGYVPHATTKTVHDECLHLPDIERMVVDKG